MYCSALVYPVGFALSDLETYYRAGTFQTGLVKLMQTVGKAESDAKTAQDNNKPAPTPDSKATLDANQTAAMVKATAPTPAKIAAKTNSMTAACKAPTGSKDTAYLPLPSGPTAKVSPPASTSFAGKESSKLPL